MSDPRTTLVAGVLREAGVTANFDDLDTLATKVVARLDADAAGDNPAAGANTSAAADTAAAAATPPRNPETPIGTGTDGGGPGSAA